MTRTTTDNAEPAPSKPFGVFTPTGSYVRETDDPENVPSVAGVDVAHVTRDKSGSWVYLAADGTVCGTAEQVEDQS